MSILSKISSVVDFGRDFSISAVGIKFSTSLSVRAKAFARAESFLIVIEASGC
ncbi:hypothetical protein THIOM_003640 [Candidatus Thiomargarita nelsonii]|uniref:Uncharacterized protein n=1 Tax=Candidatus Thiomargarita nelsonii TaxID=1003181 RepID=A0A176RY59_9GAMM|nr:hypothetical protein THIOM_003640 [Candidatus Thiomargarita nelsonii]